MERRTFLNALFTSPVLVALLQACGDDEEAGQDMFNESDGIARSQKPQRIAGEEEAAAATAVINLFGADLFSAIVDSGAQDATNVVFSPASIALALAMTRAGAAGTTAAEMDTVLRVTDPGALAPSMNALSTALESRSESVPVSGAEPAEVVLAIANSLWAQKDLAFETAFLDLLAVEFGAGLQLVDYRADPEQARNLINAWVEDQTMDRIPELLAPRTLTTDSRLTLVNAIYMKAPWLSAFEDGATAPASFTTLAGATVQASTMHVSESFNVASGAGWQAIELPYRGDKLSMLVVLPEPGGSLAEAVAAIASIGGASAPARVNLSLPKFDIETSVGLADVLAAMGMPTAFTNDADFSAMTSDEVLKIGAVIHQANITVDEKGTEAAAATAVVMETASGPADDPINLVVDRPFVFAIRDNPTGAILFLGHIGDPTETRN